MENKFNENFNSTNKESKESDSSKKNRVSDLKQRIRSAAEKIILGLDPSRLLFDIQEIYGQCTSGSTRIIPMVVQVVSVEEIQFLVQVANEFKISLYPISTGKNWGYGTANPVEHNCIVVDLSKMNRILDFDPDLGVIQVEPGVTQGQLQKFLDEHNFSFLIPVTGAGPSASLVGNLLERGFGITPHTDHFGSLLSLKAVLANGEIYQSVFADLNCEQISQSFKWGLGPYLDGLFAQSNMGIVYQCSFSLMKKPESCEAFVFMLKEETDLIKASEALRKLNQNLPGILGGMNLMNAARMLSMNISYPHEILKGEKSLSSHQIQKLAKENAIDVWTGIGGIYGTKDVVKAAKKEIRRQLKPFVKDLKFANQKTLKLLKAARVIVPSFLGKSNLEVIEERLTKLLNVIEGRPTEAALPLAYWKLKDRKYENEQNSNLVDDDCGLIWYSPLVMNKPHLIETYVTFVTEICQSFQIEPLITLTTLSEKCFDSTVPILFDRRDPEQTRRARQCYEALLFEGQKLGFFPYRLGIDQMKKITSTKSVHWSTVAKIKESLDPKNILSPSRYSPNK